MGSPALAHNLRVIRAVRNLTQVELARRAELHPTYISALERGLAPSREVHVAQLARALDVDPEVLTGSRLNVVEGALLAPVA